MASNKFPDNTKTLIYLIQDPISGEIRYVGKTTGFKQRKLQHLYSHDQTYCRNWIRKLQSQKIMPIFIPFLSCLFKDSAELERHYIKEYNTKRPFGCNLTNGGEGNLGHKHSEKTKQLISKANSIKRGFKHTEFTKNKLKTMRLGPNNPFYGKTHSDQHKEKLSQLLKKRRQTKRFPIKDQYETIYTSIYEFCIITKTHRSDVYRHLNGRYKQVKGFILTKC